MKKTLQPIVTSLRVGVTVAALFVAALVTGSAGEQVEARFGRTDRGALTLEQAIVTAVLSAAAIALGVVIVGAIASHQSSIR
jgi:hypothetical protein